jgi:hypothetical protein
MRGLRSGQIKIGGVRGAHDSIKPGVQRAKRANPRIAIQKGFSPRKRAKELDSQDRMTRDDDSAVARFAGLGRYSMAILGLPPQALCFRALRALYLKKSQA